MYRITLSGDLPGEYLAVRTTRGEYYRVEMFVNDYKACLNETLESLSFINEGDPSYVVPASYVKKCLLKIEEVVEGEDAHV